MKLQPKVQIISFGYKHGAPEDDRERSIIIDIRNQITNPWRDESLRKLSGLDRPVVDFLLRCPKTQQWVDASIFWPYEYNTIYIGCTGGRHRSVAIAEMVAASYRTMGITVEVTHRDLNKVEA